MHFAPSAADDSHLWLRRQKSAGRRQPARLHEAVSVDLAKPALRARAAVNGIDVSSATTTAPALLAAATLPSVEPEST